MGFSVAVNRRTGPRHSILDLAPLELECMRALWLLGEGTVGDIHHKLADLRPRAYTTILTIMNRLQQKEIVTRRKVGRAYRYQARLSAEEARLSAVEKIIAGFFSGSADALATHLATQRQANTATTPDNAVTASPEESLAEVTTSASDAKPS
jgi:BlaI family penicillinase repressor